MENGVLDQTARSDPKNQNWYFFALQSILPAEPVQLKVGEHQGIMELHYEPGETIFHQGDIGDYLTLSCGGIERSFEKTERNTSELPS